MKNVFFVLFVGFFYNSLFAQTPIANPTNVPCYKKKKICNYKLVANCNNLVAYDDRTNTYLSKSDYQSLYTGKCSACYRNGVLDRKSVV
jgi:hypothetical protein